MAAGQVPPIHPSHPGNTVSTGQAGGHSPQRLATDFEMQGHKILVHEQLVAAVRIAGRHVLEGGEAEVR